LKGKLWNNIQYELKDNIFNKDILSQFITKFYSDHIKILADDQHILFLFRIVLINNDIKTSTKLLKLDNDLEKKDNLIELLFEKLLITHESYNEIPIKAVIISYGIRKGKIISSINAIPRLMQLEKDGGISVSGINNKKNHHVYYNHKLPIALNPLDYGDLIGQFGQITVVSFKKFYNIIIDSSPSLALSEGDNPRKGENIKKIKYFKNGQLLYEWTDHIKEDKSLIREIGKTSFLWKDGVIQWTKILKETKPIKNKRLASRSKENFITMDLETISKQEPNGVSLSVYLLSWYDGKRDKSHSYFINTTPNPNCGGPRADNNGNIRDIIYRAMRDICIRKYKGYKIYMHNFAKFDAIFMIKYLIQIGDCHPIIHKDKIISFSFSPKWKKDFTRVVFYDSYLLLNNSLKKLGDSFSIDSPKILFPIHLSDLNYKGSVPDINYFKDSTNALEYQNYRESYKDKIWNFKEESISYCEIDCKALYQILLRFNKLIFDKFHLNITDFPTLPSLAYNIFRSNFYKKEEIHQLSGKIDKDIRLGYTGGSVDMFIPKNPIGTKIYAYDVNSLYPFVMKDRKFPIGSPVYFEGDILKDDQNAFGFFYCKIIAPKDLKHPILQLHHKIKPSGAGVRTISPTGSWEGMYFSEELYNAKLFGYKFDILRGYSFEKGDIFKDYIDNLYNLRLQYDKSNPLNFTAKILLNSLYGRFGMNDDFDILEIVNQKDLLEIESENYNISNIRPLSEDKFLISYSNPESEILTLMDGAKETHNVNIAIAAAVTAYARIHMSQFKNNPAFPNLYYTDTDSVYFDGPLPDSFISPNELGKLKLEGIYDRTIFLAPKVYALQNHKDSIIKIKGLNKDSIKNNNINLDILESLLIKNTNIEFLQDKWFRSLSKGAISILKQSYNLKVTDNKRELIYNKNGKLIRTDPLNLG